MANTDEQRYSGFRLNLLTNARYQMSQTGGRVVRNGDHVKFYAANGRTCTVWFPTEGRVKDIDIADMREAIKEMSGHNAFTL